MSSSRPSTPPLLKITEEYFVHAPHLKSLQSLTADRGRYKAERLAGPVVLHWGRHLFVFSKGTVEGAHHELLIIQ